VLPRVRKIDSFRRFVFGMKRARKVRSRGLGECRSKLIAQGARAHLFYRALGELTELERSEGQPDQAVDLKPDTFEHAPDLAVLAFAQHHREPAVGALHVIEGRLDAGIPHTLKRQTFAEPIEYGLIRFALRADAVTPDPAGRGQFEDPREPPIIGEEQQPFAINVEAADANDARAGWPMLAKIIENRRPPPRIARGRNEAAGLMKQKEPRAGAMGERLAVDSDLVIALDVDRRVGQRLTVQGDAAFADPSFRLAPGAEPSPRHDLGDAVSAFVAIARHGLVA
jgi:hypothetical protein